MFLFIDVNRGFTNNENLHPPFLIPRVNTIMVHIIKSMDILIVTHNPLWLLAVIVTGEFNGVVWKWKLLWYNTQHADTVNPMTLDRSTQCVNLRQTRALDDSISLKSFVQRI